MLIQGWNKNRFLRPWPEWHAKVVLVSNRTLNVCERIATETMTCWAMITNSSIRMRYGWGERGGGAQLIQHLELIECDKLILCKISYFNWRYTTVTHLVSVQKYTIFLCACSCVLWGVFLWSTIVSWLSRHSAERRENLMKPSGFGDMFVKGANKMSFGAREKLVIHPRDQRHSTPTASQIQFRLLKKIPFITWFAEQDVEGEEGKPTEVWD